MRLVKVRCPTRLCLFQSFLFAGLFSLGANEAPRETNEGDQKVPDGWFTRTAADRLRELSTDRPDRTESPYTVDNGHFQIEADILAWTVDDWNFARRHEEELSILTANLKIGLSRNSDLQFVLPSYTSTRSREGIGHGVEKKFGFGDLTTRLKINLWGNDGGPTAFGVMPFIRWPTASKGLGNDSVEGGLILPLAVELPAGWGMGVMTELDVNRNGNDQAHHLEWINSITVNHKIVGKLDGYVELFTALSAEQHSTSVATMDFGLIYGVSENVQLDAGVNIGATRSAPDFNPFMGITIRY